MRKYIYILISLIMISHVNAKAFYEDSLKNVRSIEKFITYDHKFPFIKYEYNFLNWMNYTSVNRFYKKLEKAKQQKVKVLHIGDSHIQYDLVSTTIRKNFHDLYGSGGWGFVFPYSAAKLHATYDYNSKHHGQWDFAKNIQPDPKYDLGITGISIHTNDSLAGFSIQFRNTESIREDYRKLKIYCKRNASSFDLKLTLKNGVNIPINTYVSDSLNQLPYVEVELPIASHLLSFTIDKTASEQNFFELYGVLIESVHDSGVLYSSAGINGAKIESVLKENLLDSHLAAYQPDAVVLDIGINDFYPRGFDETQIRKQYQKLIDKIRSAAPHASIILSDVQDAYYYHINIKACQFFSDILRDLAFKNNCAFYNYYNVSGSSNSMLKWLQYGLTKYDRLHLTNKGYQIRGKLFFNALLNSYNMISKRTIKDSLVHYNDIAEVVLPDKEIPVTYAKVNPTEGNKVYYKVRSGDYLSRIAQMFHVYVRDIMRWNNLSGHMIHAGQTLVIYSNNAQVMNVSHNTSTQLKPQKTSAKSYTVVKGDTLWDISKRFNVSVDQLKTWNKLSNNNLQIGKQLIISK